MCRYSGTVSVNSVSIPLLSISRLARGSLYVSLPQRHRVALETGVTTAKSQQDDWDN